MFFFKISFFQFFFFPRTRQHVSVLSNGDDRKIINITTTNEFSWSVAFYELLANLLTHSVAQVMSTWRCYYYMWERQYNTCSTFVYLWDLSFRFHHNISHVIVLCHWFVPMLLCAVVRATGLIMYDYCVSTICVDKNYGYRYFMIWPFFLLSEFMKNVIIL